MAQPESQSELDESAAEYVSGVDRRERLHHTIKSLVNLRQQVFVSYCQLSGVSSFATRESEQHEARPTELRNFCQIMVDYTAMGHFEVYQRIIDGKERRKAIKEIAQEVYPAIAETTDYLIDFNDKYDAFESSTEEVEMLAADLSKLGQILAVRGELEDQILEALAR